MSTYKINDKNLIEELKGDIHQYILSRYGGQDDFPYPLDADVIKTLSELEAHMKASSLDYSCADKLDELWTMLLRKSIQCLRYFDKREPFMEHQRKTPVAYGLDRLSKYHQEYTNFESLLYAASPYYRDHVFHVVRVWMLGIFLMLKEMSSGKRFINAFTLDGESHYTKFHSTNEFEHISMWTIIALCHDLGYPLEKADGILGKTQEMMKAFVPSPNIWNNFTYSGTQDTINDYIVRFISTKMRPCDNSADEGTLPSSDDREDTESERTYVGRIQPKYYLKYSKSLEAFNHGIISAIIIYKNLLYFLESDFNLNDDHEYSSEDSRQFYLRREMLRAIAAHTCSDVYNMTLTTFSSFLFLCDEMQEWGRRTWSNFYNGSISEDVELSIEEFTSSKLCFKETFNLGDMSKDQLIDRMVRIFERQYTEYRTKFRDGQQTSKSEFNIMKTIELKLNHTGAQESELVIRYCVSGEDSYFSIDESNASAADSKVFEQFKERTKDNMYATDVKRETNR